MPHFDGQSEDSFEHERHHISDSVAIHNSLVPLVNAYDNKCACTTKCLRAINDVISKINELSVGLNALASAEYHHEDYPDHPDVPPQLRVDVASTQFTLFMRIIKQVNECAGDMKRLTDMIGDFSS